MASYYKNAPDAVSINVENVPSSPTPSAGQNKGPKYSFATLALGATVGLLSLIGFIMAAYAVSKVNKAKEETKTLTSAILISDLTQKDQYPDYKLVANVFRGTGYWAPKQEMLFSRSDHGVVVYRDSAYIVGGLSNLAPPNDTTAAVQSGLTRYNALFSTLDTLAPMPEGRARFAYAVLGDKLYVMGGSPYNAAGESQAAKADVMVYDFPSNTWSTTAAAPMTVAKSDAAAVAINGKIYVAGGYDDSFSALNTIEVYDPAANTWTLSNTKMSIPRGDLVAVASGNQMYILGGTTPIAPAGVDCTVQWFKCSAYSNLVERFNPADNSIVTLAPMKYGRADFGAVEVSPGRILVAGGESNLPAQGVDRLLALPWVEEYNVQDNYWTPKSPLPEPQFRFAMALLSDQVLAFGGQPNCPNRDPTDEKTCIKKGLKTVVGYSDVTDPGVYVLARTK